LLPVLRLSKADDDKIDPVNAFLLRFL
jgi:hypothetical protein